MDFGSYRRGEQPDDAFVVCRRKRFYRVDKTLTQMGVSPIRAGHVFDDRKLEFVWIGLARLG